MKVIKKSDVTLLADLMENCSDSWYKKDETNQLNISSHIVIPGIFGGKPMKVVLDKTQQPGGLTVAREDENQVLQVIDTKMFETMLEKSLLQNYVLLWYVKKWLYKDNQKSLTVCSDEQIKIVQDVFSGYALQVD